MINPEKLCRKHLLGEHVELHMLVGSINKNRLNGVIGLCKKGLLEPSKIKQRHAALVKEMKKRGYNHKSPLPEYSLPDEIKNYKVNLNESKKELKSRCNECYQ